MARLALLIGALAAVTHAQNSWSWFYSDMCGCTQTKFEGCGVSSAQLFKVLTDSHGLQVCTNTSGLGDTAEGKTSKAYMGDEKLAQRVKDECEVRMQLKTVAADFEVCRTLKGEAACAEKKELCEWEAQDMGECGIDEEKLLYKLVPEAYSRHPLVQNILIQDRCSEMSETLCVQNKTCAWVPHHKRCVANDAITFNAFIEHPALFQILEIADRGAECRGWYEHVWHGNTCWEHRCHLERGICTGNVGYTLDAEPNATSVQEMKNDMCRLKGYSWQGQQGEFKGNKGKCPPGCRVNKQSGTDDEQLHGHDGHGGGHHGHFGEWVECEAEPMAKDADLSLTEMDKKIALYFLVLRSATTIHESRCNSLDIDLHQCQKVASSHIDCQGMFHPNATEIFGDWHGHHGGHHGHRHEGEGQNADQDQTTAVAAVSSTQAKQAEDAAMTNVVSNIAKPDAGLGVNGGMNDIVFQATSTNKEAFIQSFSNWMQQPETQNKLLEIRDTLPEYVQGFRTMLQDTAPTAAPTTAPPALESKKEDSLTSHAALVCAGCLMLAGICGGFAWGVLMTNRMQPARGPALLETEYMRHA